MKHCTLPMLFTHQGHNFRHPRYISIFRFFRTFEHSRETAYLSIYSYDVENYQIFACRTRTS